MATDLSYAHVVKTNNEAARLTRLSRVRVSQIAMDYLAHGWSVEEMCRQYPHLHLSEVHSAMAYYFDHQAEIDDEIRRELADSEIADAMNASPLRLRLRSLRDA